MSKKKPNIALNEKIALCEGYTKQWADFFNFFGDGFEGRKITAESEAQFFRAMTDLARHQFRLQYFLGDDFQVGGKIIALLAEAVSLVHIHGMSEAQFSQFQLKWHTTFIALNKCIGRLLAQRPVSKEEKKNLLMAAIAAGRKARTRQAQETAPPAGAAQQPPAPTVTRPPGAASATPQQTDAPRVTRPPSDPSRPE